ncbi:Adaptor protein complex 3 (AP-3), sigma subunit [Blattamonas nauphoetae]|uniref:AP complex subunit sigma n=1 Tax=Blattamonas nauphoetae TaxID=2049346 RepID=A0ABQ9XYW6_9EUKA|nr:Adaptor protein complex 3 (AP-3), sigma subunit [Blattamonas nauphoetae]
MIYALFVINNHGTTRLSRFYQAIEYSKKKTLERDIYGLIAKRPIAACNFIENTGIWSDDKSLKIIYRTYATLTFVLVADQAENELAMLDLIQNYVECLDDAFQNVCELHLIFQHEKCFQILDEIISGGLILETRSSDVLPHVAAMERLDRASR